MLQIEADPPAPVAEAEAGVPPQVELILSALETARYHCSEERRTMPRRPYRVRGRLKFFSDVPYGKPWTVYTREVNARGLGFVTPHRLPLGYGGFVELPHPDGGMLKIPCTLIRCRQAAPGWYEGAVYFNREQPVFAVPADEDAADADHSATD